MKLLAYLALLLTTATANAEWKSDTELGLVSQRGNAEQDNTFFRLKLTKDKILTHYYLSAEGGYISSSGQDGSGETTRLAESSYAGGRLGRDFSERFSIYNGILYEKNRFAGFEDRISADIIGATYYFKKEESNHFFTELAYRARNQYAFDPVRSGRGDKTESQFARVYFEYARKFSKTSRFQFWVENLYDFEDSENFEMNFEPSIDVAIGEFFSSQNPAKVSLKLAYLGRFDNVPAQEDFEKFDSTVSTTLKILY